ncbi:MAG TPA: hypothetical protein EYO33_24240 [Phycisphaerales bacterium]|nr:hypothetical protein [Phycisphaerales bacterium]
MSSDSKIDWLDVEQSLSHFWNSLPAEVRVVSQWTPSRRFSELTYVREELLGSYKARKYLSLIPWLREQGFERIRVAGSSHSGNVTQLGLLLRQNGMEPVYLFEGRGGPPAGNQLLSQLVYGSSFKTDSGDVDFEIPEGGSHPAALAGSLGLAGSLVEKSLEQNTWTTRIFMDSGTGFSAAALLLGLGFFNLPCRVTIVSMTGQSSEDIQDICHSLSGDYGRLFDKPPRIPEFEVNHPPVGPSFGSVPAASLAEVAAFAQQEAILIDPIYTAKLSLYYQQQRVAGQEALMFLSGGVRELLCFQGPLRKWLEQRQSQ